MSVKKEQLIELMDTLSNIMLKQGEPFRARAYQKAQETFLSLKENIIMSTEQLKNKPNIGPAIIDKINEFIQVIYLNQKSKSYYKKYFYSFINLSYNSILILFSLCNLIIASISNSL